ncbi:MAG: transketolase, partial [Salinisphaera sp.]|nr:transketolase [Salinisphaera sp.]
ESGRPTLICCKTVIGWGSPNKQGTAGVHGAALGEEEVAAARKTLDWQDDTPFAIPQPIYDAWDKREAGAAAEQQWQALHSQYREQYPEQAAEFDRRQHAALPDNWAEAAQAFVRQTQAQGKKVATRVASKATIAAYAELLPELFGGSADLSGSNGTDWDGHRTITAGDFGGNYLYYGVREFGMTAITSGIALHRGLIPFSGTFLTFSDYARNAVRLAALMGLRNILVYTHDSIGLGEDGPTHQSVEHVASLRLIPNLHVWRPADDVETAVAWRAALEREDGPSALALTRQGVAHQERDQACLETVARGGYILWEPEAEPEAIVIATGSEVELAVAAARTLADEGRAVRVVSMPCVAVFDAQNAAYRARVLPPELTRRVAVEAGVSQYWWKFVGSAGRVLGVDDYGESAPYEEVYAHFGLTEAGVAQALRELLA